MSNGVRKKQVMADAALLFIAIVWGLNFIIIKTVVINYPPMLYLGIRFTLASLLLALAARTKLKALTGHQLKRAGAVGLLLFGGFAFQTIGLQDTTPGISGFLTVVYVVLVPLISFLIARETCGLNVVLGSLLTFAGVCCLTISSSLTWGRGEILTLLSALCFALHILALDRVTTEMDTYSLTTIQLGVVGVFSLLLSIFCESFSLPTVHTLLAITYGVFLGSILGYFVQTRVQRYTLPSHAAIILSLEAAFALLFSVIFGMETLNPRNILGFILVGLGLLVVELITSKQKA